MTFAQAYIAFLLTVVNIAGLFILWGIASMAWSRGRRQLYSRRDWIAWMAAMIIIGGVSALHTAALTDVMNWIRLTP